MIAFAWLFLLAVSSKVELVNEDYQIPPHDWRYVAELGIKQQPGMVLAEYQVKAGPGLVRLILMHREDLERLRHNLPHSYIELTPRGRAGNLRRYIHDLGDYVLMVDNRDGDHAAGVHLSISMDFGQGALSPERQLTVIILSFAVFFGIVTWSGRRLLQAVKRNGR
jgi:hypothetical protein